MQIHELNTLDRLPKSTDFLAIDTGFDTAKIPANALFADDDVVAAAISEWLDNHPEATTTVQDHSLTYEKFVTGTLGYVMPEMYGAKGDGVTDDTAAINDAVASGMPVLFSDKSYLVSDVIAINNSTKLIGNNAKIIRNVTQKIASFDFMFRIMTQGLSLEIDGINIVLSVASGIYIDSGSTVTTAFQIFRTAYNDFEFTLKNSDIVINGVNNQINLMDGGGCYAKELIFDNVKVHYDSDVKQGGLLWFSNSAGQTSNVKISNSYFEQNCHDEIIAFYGAGEINALFENCVFIANDCAIDPQDVFIASMSVGSDSVTKAKFVNCKMISNDTPGQPLFIKADNVGAAKTATINVLEFEQCDFDVYATERFVGGTNSAAYDNMQASVDHVRCVFTGCTINIKNSVTGQGSRFSRSDYGCNIIANNCKISCPYRLIDTLQTETINPHRLLFVNCEIWTYTTEGTGDGYRMLYIMSAHGCEYFFVGCSIVNLNLNDAYTHSVFILSVSGYNPTKSFENTYKIRFDNCYDQNYNAIANTAWGSLPS